MHIKNIFGTPFPRCTLVLALSKAEVSYVDFPVPDGVPPTPEPRSPALTFSGLSGIWRRVLVTEDRILGSLTGPVALPHSAALVGEYDTAVTLRRQPKLMVIMAGTEDMLTLGEDPLLCLGKSLLCDWSLERERSQLSTKKQNSEKACFPRHPVQPGSCHMTRASQLDAPAKAQGILAL